MPGSGQKHSLVALVFPPAWYVGTRVHLGTCSLEEVTQGTGGWIPEPCHPPCPRPWAGLGRRTEAFWVKDLKSRWKPLAPPESREYQTAGPAWEPV